MFFTGFATESDEIAGEDAQIRVRVPFTGGRRGALDLSIGTGVARTLAGDFLGVDGENGTSEEQVQEVVRELANMICGDALSHVERGSLHLGAPEVVTKAATLLPSDASRRSFDLVAGTLTVAIGFEDGGDV